MPTLFGKPSVKTKTTAVIYAVESVDLDTAIMSGQRIGRWRRWASAFERWLACLVTPGIVFGVAADHWKWTEIKNDD